MVYWITGNSGSGKTTLASKIKQQIPNSVMLEADYIRTIWKAKEYDYELITNMALLLENGGHTVIISGIGPIASEIDKLKAKFNECLIIDMPFGRDGKGRSIK